MRIRRRVFCVINLAAVLLLACGSASVFGQGGTGKMPPIRMPPPNFPRKMPPPRRDPLPEKRPAIGDIYVVPGTEPLSINDRLPEELGQFRRNKLETNGSDSTNDDFGAVEVLRAEYGKDILIFLSQFKDAAGANSTMQTFAKKVAGSYSTVSRKHIKNRSGRTLGEFWLMKISGKEKNVYLLVTNGSYLYRIYGFSSDDVQKVFKSLPLE